jgi:DNA-binding CsgD family transcriptional regulator
MSDNIFTAVANTMDGVCVMDAREGTVVWNRAAQQLTGFTSADALGKFCYQVRDEMKGTLCVECRPDCPAMVALRTGAPVPCHDCLSRTKSGEMRWFNVSIITVPRDVHQGTRAIILFRDVTRERNMERLAARILSASDEFRARHNGRSIVAAAPRPAEESALTERQQEVLALLAAGESTGAIAEALSISPVTVRNHVQRILNALGVHSRLEAVLLARETGLI